MEMIERVAEAIADAMNMNRVGRLEMEAAHAAIQAMREPTEEMMPSEVDTYVYGLVKIPADQLKLIYQSLIDDALSGKSGMGEG